ncbi:MAG: glutaredoxin family protein [Hydrocarboniphaga sp.]|nr:glutaredoxin family protein [Hydrocarboniphaga sp.]
MLLSRPGCHLCEQMAMELLTAYPQLAGQVAEADVDSREDWQRRYGLKIPVLLDTGDGGVVCATVFDSAAVADWVRDRNL